MARSTKPTVDRCTHSVAYEPRNGDIWTAVRSVLVFRAAAENGGCVEGARRIMLRPTVTTDENWTDDADDRRGRRGTVLACRVRADCFLSRSLSRLRCALACARACMRFVVCVCVAQSVFLIAAKRTCEDTENGAALWSASVVECVRVFFKQTNNNIYDKNASDKTQ